MKKFLNIGHNAARVLTVLLAVALLSAQAAWAVEDPRPRRTGIKIEVEGSGIYRLTGQDMINSGVRIDSIDPARLRMFHLDREIAVEVSAAGSFLGAGDAVLFYAPGVDNRYTGKDVFWLYWGGDVPGARMDRVDGTPLGDSSPVDAFKTNMRIEENRVLWSGVPGAPEADFWFWERLTSPQSGIYRFDAPEMAGTNGSALLRVFLQGRGAGLHDVAVSLNGASLGRVSWSGSQAHDKALSFPQASLKSRDNELKLDYQGPTGGIIYVNRFELEYQRRLAADEGRLHFTVSAVGGRDMGLSGFSGEGTRIYNITNPAAPVKVENARADTAGTGFRHVFAHPGGTRSWVAVDEKRIPSPVRVASRAWPRLANTSNQADYILITDADLAPAVEKLLELRRRQGLKTFVAPVEDIYDVFSFGRFDPMAIRDFLSFAWQNWQKPAPEFVLLAGDANLDYRNHYRTPKKNIVPGMLVPDTGLGMIPSDNMFACVSGNSPVPDLYIGRIPGSSRQALADIVHKLILYESDRHQNANRVLLVADDEKPFEELSDRLADIAAPGFGAETIFSRSYSQLSGVTADIVSSVNSGMFLTGFVGHGDVTRWGVNPYGAGISIFAPGDLAGLSNSRQLTVLLALNCLNGYFSQPFDHSLAEEWVMASGRGAVGAFAPAGLSYLWEHEQLGKLFFEKIFMEGENRLGVIATEAKIEAYRSGVSEKVLTSFNLIGDPATRLAVNRGRGDVVHVQVIAADASAGGTVYPAGEVAVFQGAKQTFAIKPNTGHRIRSVTVDGRHVSPESAPGGENDAEYAYQYTFSAVMNDHALKVVFEREDGSGGWDDDDWHDGGGGGSSSSCFIGAIVPR